MMTSDNNFDQRLKAVLNNLEAPYDPATWALLEHRLDAAFTEEEPPAVAPVDKALYHTLERLEAPYEPAHWQLLDQRLRLQNLRIRRLRLGKLAEAAVFLLLLANLPLFHSYFSTPNETRPTLLRPDVPVAQASPGSLKHPAGHRTARQKTSAAGMPVVAPAVFGATQSTPNAAPAAAQASFLSNDYIVAPSLTAVLSDLPSGVKNTPDRSAVPIAGLLPGLVPDALKTPDPNPAFRLFPTKVARQKGPFYVAVFASADENRVTVGNTQRRTTSAGAGVNAGFRRNGWTIETGLEWSGKAYAPKKQIEIYKGNLQNGYYGSTLAEVQAECISVPVKAMRRIARLGNTSAHAVAGLSTTVAVQKSYDYATVYYPPGSTPSGIPPNTTPDQKPSLQLSGKGALENGGSLRGNVYASADLGLRLEQRLGNGRYTAFVEPVFKQSLTGKGIGPKQEAINTLTVKAGVMAFL